MTTYVDLTIQSGQAFSQLLPATGLATVGRGLRCHIRSSGPSPLLIQVLTHDGAANARVSFAPGGAGVLVVIGATVSAAWLVGREQARWVFDVESYLLADDDDVIITHSGAAIVPINVTRPNDVTPSPPMPNGDARYLALGLIAPGTNAAPVKTTPVDADLVPLIDSAAENLVKKLSWANIKTTLKTYLDTFYATAAQGTDARTPTAHNHAAGDITTGTMAPARLGSGTADATTVLHGDQTYKTPAGGGISGLTTGAVLFGGAGGGVEQDSPSFSYNNVTKTLEINKAVAGTSAAVDGTIKLYNRAAAGNSGAGFEVWGWADNTAALSPFGRIGFRRWSSSDGRFGEFVIFLATNNAIGETPLLTLDPNGNLRAPSIVGSPKISAQNALGNVIGLYQSTTGVTPDVSELPQGGWANGHFNMVLRASENDLVQLDWQRRVAIGYPIAVTPESQGKLSVRNHVTDTPVLALQTAASATAGFLQCLNSGGSVLAQIRADASWAPPTMADSAALANSLYYSSTGSKLAYKDPSGTVHYLY